MTAQEKERITRLRGEGKSYGAIATLLGISASKVKSYCTMAKSITRIEVKNRTFFSESVSRLMRVFRWIPNG